MWSTLAATGPSLRVETAPSAGLSIASVAVPDTVTAGGSMDVTVTMQHRGALDAGVPTLVFSLRSVTGTDAPIPLGSTMARSAHQGLPDPGTIPLPDPAQPSC